MRAVEGGRITPALRLGRIWITAELRAHYGEAAPACGWVALASRLGGAALASVVLVGHFRVTRRAASPFDLAATC